MRIYKQGKRTLVVLGKRDIQRLRHVKPNSHGEVCFSTTSKPKRLTYGTSLYQLKLTPLHR